MSNKSEQYDNATITYMLIGILKFLADQKLNSIPGEYFQTNYANHTAAVTHDEYNNVYIFNLINDEEFGNAP